MRGIHHLPMFAILVALLQFGTGCNTTTTYCVRRSALVPVPTPPQRPAALNSGIVEGGFGVDNVLWASPPRRSSGRNVGLYVPRVQLQGNFLLAWNAYVSLGMGYEVALNDGAMAIAPGLISPPGEDSAGAGPEVRFHFPFGENFVLDIGCEVKIYGVSSNIEYSECEGDLNEDGVLEQGTRTEHTTFILPRVWLAVGGELGWSTVTMGAGIRPHPTNTDETVETLGSSSDISPEFDYTMYPFLFFGWEFHIRRIAHIGVTIHQPLLFDPVAYAPVLGINLRLTHLSDGHRFNTQEHRERWRRRHGDES